MVTVVRTRHYTWTGSLAQGASITVNLPTVTVASGSYTFTAYTDLPNGSADLNLANDQSESGFTIFTGPESLPFNEDFESNTFNTNLWTISNPDNGITWEILTVAGSSPGDKAAKIDLVQLREWIRKRWYADSAVRLF